MFNSKQLKKFFLILYSIYININCNKLYVTIRMAKDNKTILKCM